MQDEADWLSPGNDFSSLSSDLLCSPEETTRVSQSIVCVCACVRVQEGERERESFMMIQSKTMRLIRWLINSFFHRSLQAYREKTKQ